MLPALLFQETFGGHPSGKARALVLFLGLALCGWAAMRARNRSVLIPTLTLLLTIGGGVIVFAVYPVAFDSISYLLGIAYPPVFYVILALCALLVVILHLSMRLSIMDERCRKLAQEISLMRAEGSGSGGLASATIKVTATSAGTEKQMDSAEAPFSSSPL